VNSLNYLIPIDVRISRESDIKDRSVRVDGNELNVISLDACRNDPYTKKLRSARTSISLGGKRRGCACLRGTAVAARQGMHSSGDALAEVKTQEPFSLKFAMPLTASF
jgi:hypothetical protein